MTRNAVGLSERQHIRPGVQASGNLSHLIHFKRICRELTDMCGLINHVQKAQMFAQTCFHRNHHSVLIRQHPRVILHTEGPESFPGFKTKPPK